MNIFSNIGITELVVVLLIALIVVGPERLPEMGAKLAKVLRDFRNMYENLTRDLGPELMSLQETTQEIRDSVESVRTIPQDMIQSMVEAADLDDTIEELKGVTGSIEQVGQTMSAAGQVIKNPVGAAVDTARQALVPTKTEETEEEGQSTEPEEFEPASAAEVAPASDDPSLPENMDRAKVAEAQEPLEAEPGSVTKAAPDAGTVGSTGKADTDGDASTAAPGEPEATIDAIEEQAHE